jgi:endonuclease/exonuclease/phosphatase family metal-dependent hydrolase
MIKVASYNIHKGVGLDRLRRPERILDVLAEIDADVVGLQEADRRYGERMSALPVHMIAERSDYVAVPVGLCVNGIRLRVVTMHLDLSGLWRRKQARAIVAALDQRHPLPTILMGDLNEWRRESGCLHDFGRHYRFAQTGKSFHSQRPVARLDRIMADPSLQFSACGVHHSVRARHASDHLPIWARVETA